MDEFLIEVSLKHQRLKGIIREAVIKGTLKQGDRLPSQNEMRDIYGLSNSTVREAIGSLVHEGLLYRVQGKGTFVADWKCNRRQSQTRTKTIGLILPHVNLSFHAEVAYGCEVLARKKGHAVVLCNTDNDAATERAYLERLLDEQVDGMVISAGGCTNQNKNLLARVQERVPLVIIDVLIEGISTDYVLSDNIDGARQATNHLIAAGRKKIAHLAGPMGINTADDRLTGYRQALEAAGISIDEDLIEFTDYSQGGGYTAVNNLLRRKKEFGAIFACTDNVAMGAFKALFQHELSVPEDVVLVGFGNQVEPLRIGLSLTTVDQKAQEMGSEAVRILIDKIEKPREDDHLSTCVLPTTLVVRESSVGKRCPSELVCG